MSRIYFDEFTNSKARKLYEAVWKNNSFIDSVGAVEKAPARKDKISNNSYCFSAEEDKADLLIRVFSIANPTLFREKFKLACGGTGQEYRRITTLHSSSLCALLFFYNVTDKNPLNLEICGKTYHFTESVFEFKSPVINSPSNMDVVLVGTETETGKETVLFLESKFSEYYTAVSNHLKHISEEYCTNEYSRCFYEEEFLNSLGTKVVPDKPGYISLKSEQKYYIGGIKQMISHYIGIRNLMAGNLFNGKKSEEQQGVEAAVIRGADILLAEILFDSKIGQLQNDDGQPCIDSYAAMYAKFVEKAEMEIEAANLENRFKIAEKELGYSLFLNNHHVVEDKVLEFYF